MLKPGCNVIISIAQLSTAFSKDTVLLDVTP